MQIGIAFPLFLTFLILKLTEVIDWSWWWVTSPLWIGAALFFAFLPVFIWIWKKF